MGEEAEMRAGIKMVVKPDGEIIVGEEAEKNLCPMCKEEMKGWEEFVCWECGLMTDEGFKGLWTKNAAGSWVSVPEGLLLVVEQWSVVEQ